MYSMINATAQSRLNLLWQESDRTFELQLYKVHSQPLLCILLALRCKIRDHPANCILQSDCSGTKPDWQAAPTVWYRSWRCGSKLCPHLCSAPARRGPGLVQPEAARARHLQNDVRVGMTACKQKSGRLHTNTACKLLDHSRQGSLIISDNARRKAKHLPSSCHHKAAFALEQGADN